MAKQIVKYEIEDYSQYTTETLIEKMEMYLGRMQLIEFSEKEDSNNKLHSRVKQWFSCSLNMHNITKEINERLNEKTFDPSLN